MIHRYLRGSDRFGRWHKCIKVWYLVLVVDTEGITPLLPVKAVRVCVCVCEAFRGTFQFPDISLHYVGLMNIPVTFSGETFSV